MRNGQTLPDLSKYLGQWVVICKDQVIAHNKNLTKLDKEIDQCETIPTIAKLPKAEKLIL